MRRQKHARTAPRAARIAFEHRQRGTDDQRDEQQERQSKHQAKGHQAGSQEHHESRPRAPGDAPDLVQAALQLGENAGRPEYQEAAGEQRREQAGSGIAGGGQQGLNRLRTVRSGQALDLADDLALGRLGTKEITGDRDRQHQDRRHREQGIKGQRGALARCAVIDPRAQRREQQALQTFECCRQAGVQFVVERKTLRVVGRVCHAFPPPGSARR
jgi:hypothetical protein